jgi:hypothetical protein
MKWIETVEGCELPPVGKFVLLRLGPSEDGKFGPGVVVGVLKVNEVGPWFRPYGGSGRITHWCDCLPEDFELPIDAPYEFPSELEV